MVFQLLIEVNAPLDGLQMFGPKLNHLRPQSMRLRGAIELILKDSSDIGEHVAGRDPKGLGDDVGRDVVEPIVTGGARIRIEGEPEHQP